MKQKFAVKMTNFLNAFDYYYYFGSLGTTLEGMHQAVKRGKLKKSVAIRILRYGLVKDIHYGYNYAQINEVVSNFKKELNDG